MKNKFKPVGPKELTRKEREVFWNGHFVSGSMIKRIMHEPIQLWKEKHKLTPATIPGEDPNVRPHTNEWTKAVMQRGTYFEDGIVNMANDTLDIPHINIDKRTFQGENNVYTANIDGYIGRDINDIDDIVEVKYTSTTKLNNLLQRYIYQIMFYMWFFNVKKGTQFLIYQETIEQVEFNFDGKRFPVQKVFPRLLSKYIERDKASEKEMLEKIEIWIDALKTWDITKITWGDAEK